MRNRHAGLWMAALLAFASSASRGSETLVLPVGKKVRVQAEGVGLVTGKLVSLDEKTLVLGDGEGAKNIPRSAIESIWVQERSAKRGVIFFGLVGGVGLGVLGGLLCKEMSNFEEDTRTRGDNGAKCLGFGLMSGLAGGVGGALVGAPLGAAFPSWKLRYQREGGPGTKPPIALQPGGGQGSRSRLAGLFTLGGGFGRPGSLYGGSLGMESGLFAQLYPWLAQGIEVGWYSLGSKTFPGPGGYEESIRQSVRRLSLVTRIGPSGGSLRFKPYATGSLGWCATPLTNSYVGASLGAGMAYSLRAPWTLQTELRWNFRASERDQPGQGREFFTWTAGAAYRW